jgi:hypothetical protein
MDRGITLLRIVAQGRRNRMRCPDMFCPCAQLDHMPITTDCSVI